MLTRITHLLHLLPLVYFSNKRWLYELALYALTRFTAVSMLYFVLFFSLETKHVMISYQWDVQKSMIHLKTQLQAQGYKVWMDVDEMGGSTLESMARAVENASVVLVCVSQKYKESPNCRSGSNLHVYSPLHSLASFSLAADGVSVYSLVLATQAIATFHVVCDDFFWSVTCPIRYSFGVELAMYSQQNRLFS